jgi:hypothetical protein
MGVVIYIIISIYLPHHSLADKKKQQSITLYCCQGLNATKGFYSFSCPATQLV